MFPSPPITHFICNTLIYVGQAHLGGLDGKGWAQGLGVFEREAGGCVAIVGEQQRLAHDLTGAHRGEGDDTVGDLNL